MHSALRIFIDADACPVKNEVYKVGERHGVAAVVVSNRAFAVPETPLVEQIVVSNTFDAADDWIAENSVAGVVVITADILLAERCLKKQASVLAPDGREFTADSIGSAIATRALLEDLRAGVGNEHVGGPPPFSKADRSRFLAALHELLVRLLR